VAGDLQLAYAQFEELETFARFGARLDEDTRRLRTMDEPAKASLGVALTTASEPTLSVKHWCALILAGTGLPWHAPAKMPALPV
jgi:F-type H+-transporting ATPase subunit alpha